MFAKKCSFFDQKHWLKTRFQQGGKIVHFFMKITNFSKMCTFSSKCDFRPKLHFYLNEQNLRPVGPTVHLGGGV